LKFTPFSKKRQSLISAKREEIGDANNTYLSGHGPSRFHLGFAIEINKKRQDHFWPCLHKNELTDLDYVLYLCLYLCP